MMAFYYSDTQKTFLAQNIVPDILPKAPRNRLHVSLPETDVFRKNDCEIDFQNMFEFHSDMFFSRIPFIVNFISDFFLKETGDKIMNVIDETSFSNSK